MLSNFSITALIKALKQKGRLVYEYNPLYNYRTKIPKYKTNNRGLIVNRNGEVLGLKLTYSGGNTPTVSLFKYYSETVENSSSIKVFAPLTNGIVRNLIKNKIVEGYSLHSLLRGSCTVTQLDKEIGDFTTDQLGFDLSHPVDIKAQPSYDGSVNLIINDGKNSSKMINTRFSVTEGNNYQIPQRLNDNDSNLYDEDEFEVDSKLQKVYRKIPIIEFLGTEDGGNFNVGNYIFYFKYLDSDGNPTDFIAESGIVSCWQGSTPTTIDSGWMDTSSYKMVKFKLNNLDTSYKYLQVYYSRRTSNVDGVSQVSYHLIDNKYNIDSEELSLTLTGFEAVLPSSAQEINLQYQSWDSVKTQETLKNHLFLGNITKEEIDHKDLIDLSLRITPSINIEKKIQYEENYSTLDETRLGYYDSKNVYYNLGYYPEEFYRFGIVYILNDNTLTPVYNVAGYLFEKATSDTEICIPGVSIYNNEARGSIIDRLNRVYEYDGDFHALDMEGNRRRAFLEVDNIKGVISNTNLNTKGVVKMPEICDNSSILGIRFNIPKEVYRRLSAKNIKGYMFVRQRRMPTILTQGVVIGLDKEAHIPLLKTDKFFAERFIDNERMLSYDYGNRIYKDYKDGEVYPNKAFIAPEVSCRLPYFNQFFTGEDFVCKKLFNTTTNQSFSNERSYFIKPKDKVQKTSLDFINTIVVQDSSPLITNGKYKYSAKAGNEEEAWRISYLGNKTSDTEAKNIIRGNFGTYVGIDKYTGEYGDYLNIYIAGYSSSNFNEYLKVRAGDKSNYYPISDRISILDYSYNDYNIFINQVPMYRGDCFINQFTHRIHRNFIDPEVPLNDEIIEDSTWRDEYKYGENSDTLSRGDINAVPIGTWVTLTVRSNVNLGVRGEDLNYPLEVSTYQRGRSFYPKTSMSPYSDNKLPESSVLNSGFSYNVSEKYNTPLPEVPYFRNEYDTRIMYSDVFVNDAFTNGYRVFTGTNYVDYPKELGSITKILRYGDYLLCVFTHGVAFIGVNERIQIGNNSTNGEVILGSDKVISKEGIKIISDSLGSQWSDSICASSRYVYGYDTVAKKLWRVSLKGIEVISDFKVQSFLNLNTSLKERETLPIEGLRNVSTHYNAYKQDIMFTLYNGSDGIQEKAWNLCFNELENKFTTFYSWIPSKSINIDNMWFSFDRDTVKYITKLADSTYTNPSSIGITLTKPIIDNNSLRNGVITWGCELKYKSLDKRISASNFILDPTDINSKYFSINSNTLSFNLAQWVTDNNLDITTVESFKSSYKRWVLDESKAYQLREPIITFNVLTREAQDYIGDYNYKIVKNDNGQIDLGVHSKKLAITFECLLEDYSRDSLFSTDFWKHGQAGIFDLKDDIKPTHWYGKQHPFEFEFVVNDQPTLNKLLTNLTIISNYVEPSSIHYTIEANNFLFKDDMATMYRRQELVKSLLQLNNFNISYDKSFRKHLPKHTVKTTYLFVDYSKQDRLNSIYHNYLLKSNVNYNYINRTGSELVYNPIDNTFSLVISQKIKSDKVLTEKISYTNIIYRKGKWHLEVKPFIFAEKNEEDWGNTPPIILPQSGLVEEPLTLTKFPEGYSLNNIQEKGKIELYGTNGWSEPKSSFPKGNYIKVRIRYDGTQLTTIQAIQSLVILNV